MEVFLISVVLIGIAFLAMGVGIFFLPKRRFPETEVGHNKHMRELGIYCMKCEEKKSWRKMKEQQRLKIKPTELKLDLNQF